MQRLIIVFALLAYTLAAPLDDPKELSKPEGLTRPSPINPDIPSDPKPEEKITLITDPNVLPLNSTEPTKLPRGPFVLPRELLLRTKRGVKDSSESDESSSEEDKKPSRPLAAPPVSTLEKHATSAVPSTSTDRSITPSSALATTSSHPRLPYAPTIHQHNEHLFKPTTEPHSTSTSTTKSATTPQDHANDKRDIPVPLTRKFHHDEDEAPKQKEEQLPSSTSSPSPSTKVPKEETKQEEEKDAGHKAEPVASTTTSDQHPATFARPIPVAELFAKKPSTE